MKRYDPIMKWEIDMRDRYGNIRRHSRQWDIDKDINIGYVLSIWDMVIRYGYPPHRYGHPGYRYGTWANDMGDDSIDMVILGIDMGYLVALTSTRTGSERDFTSG